MMRFFDWLDNRTGYRLIAREALYERIPGGARWRYVWGSVLVFTFFVQLVTGLFLWMAYSPSAQTAWESVYYIQNEMYLGNVLRGIHHYAAQAMVVLLGIHLIQVIIDGAYRAPREVNFWLGLVLMQIVLGLSLTGYLLPWDQKGYYATQVTTKIIGATPVVGNSLQQLVQGGPQYGHHTLTRFFAMHAGVLPALLVSFLALHVYVFRRHGLTVRDPHRKPTATFWPDQILRESVVCLAVLAVVMLLAIFRGAELGAPANPAEAFSAARPEWYFLSLFRFLRFEAVEHLGLAFGAIYVPALLMLILVLMPLIAMIKGGHRFNVAFMWIITAAIIGLTGMALYEDSRDPDHQAALAEAHRDAHRVQELAQGPQKIPVHGAGVLLQNDPFTQGPRLFAKYCASCHRYDGHNGRGRPVSMPDPDSHAVVVLPPTATDLGDFGTRSWWRDVLLNFHDRFEPLAGSDYDLEASADEGMVAWSQENRDMLLQPEHEEDLAAMIEYLVSLSGRADLKYNAELVEQGRGILETGELSSGEVLSSTCTDCHTSLDEEFVAGSENAYPELNGYGSTEWLAAFIRDPGSPQFYGERNQMPAFADKMSEADILLLARWLSGDYPATDVPPYPPYPASTEKAPAE